MDKDFLVHMSPYLIRLTGDRRSALAGVAIELRPEAPVNGPSISPEKMAAEAGLE